MNEENKKNTSLQKLSTTDFIGLVKKRMKSEYKNEYKPNVKIYIFKTNGKPDVKKRWYVYFYHKNENFSNPFKIYAGINRIKNTNERLKAIKLLKKAVEKQLETDDPFSFFEKSYTFIEAVDYVFLKKKANWQDSTINTNLGMVTRFKEWIKENNLENVSINKISKRHIIEFINYIDKQNYTNTYKNTFRKFLKNFFGTMAQDNLIPYNFLSKLPLLKEMPKKNKSYNKNQLKQIKDYLIKNDPYLLDYIYFITYAFLRPKEVIRIKVKDIDIEKKQIILKTKTGYEIIPIIDKLLPVIDKFDIQKYQPEHFLFTIHKRPGIWTATENRRTKYFQDRFRKLKKVLQLSHDYGLYSFRHTFALDLYHKFIADGLTDLQAKHKLMTITRHKSLSSLNKYLRNIGVFVADDFSDDFTIDF